MEPVFDKWTPYLTDGEIVAEMTFSKEHVCINPPKGVVFGQDSDGNMYLNGRPAHVEYRHEHIDFGKVGRGGWKA